ncbi:MAG: hypothetical protein ACJA0F_000295, partial [Dinoroseobacter sp.]
MFSGYVRQVRRIAVPLMVVGVLAGCAGALSSPSGG